jgi:hypothetical protein
MKTHLIICNEADYLQAHLTAIVSEPRRGNPVFPNFTRRIASLLKKWIMAANADMRARSIHPARDSRYEQGSALTAIDPKLRLT